MSIQSVNRADSWAEFVRLVQEARSRSNGIGGGAYPVSGARKAAGLHAPSAVRSQYGVMRSEQLGAAAPVQSKTMKAIGTIFDAYA